MPTAPNLHGLHRPPRHPQAWWPCLLASQALVAWAWWRFGAGIGLPAMLASHAACWWGVLWPRSRLFSPVLSRLPTDERVAWLTIDDGPSTDTRAILDLLDARGAKATFFLVGERALQRPDEVRELLRRGFDVDLLEEIGEERVGDAVRDEQADDRPQDAADRRDPRVSFGFAHNLGDGQLSNFDIFSVSLAGQTPHLETPYVLRANGDGEAWYTSPTNWLLVGVGVAAAWAIYDNNQDDNDAPAPQVPS